MKCAYLINKILYFLALPILAVVVYYTSAYYLTQDNRLPSYKILITPNALHERCFDMQPTQQLLYSYKSSAAVDFDLHYHIDKNIIYPIRKKNQIHADEVFTANETREYCLLWKNNSKDKLIIEYTFNFFRAGQ